MRTTVKFYTDAIQRVALLGLTHDSKEEALEEILSICKTGIIPAVYTEDI